MKPGKTLKLISKRLKVTRGGRVLRRITGQGHNKAKMSGNMIRSKRRRRDTAENALIRKAIKSMYRTK